ncbi:hypothetical protein FIBSPDRAFT_1038755 [Athelia psychrophila]|uniref:Arrestin-like N-terminal domain-containing protein n=1 Tax=Athelia psychrophila TaxID=1759441 RepID=A0A166SRG9_9AGAM|nr:hypothetical protein FIBSPDRAFT_1038755 [Fibularhizoctonia sp. CBS 109695]
MDTLPVYSHDSDGPPSYGNIQSSFHLKHRNNKPWATLKVQSMARSSEGVPVFAQGGVISGSLVLELSRDAMREISIKVLGQFVQPISSERTVSPFESGPDVFLSFSQSIWSHDVSHSENSLDGKTEWPFAIPIDDLSPDHLPPSVRERNASFGVRYELFVHIRRGLMRSDDRLGGVFEYLTASCPTPFSALRQLAYETDVPIQGPDADPSGWKTMAPVKIEGSIFSNRDAHVTCTLSIAMPLIYTKGTAIPCYLVLGSPDKEVLDLLSSRNAIDIRLQRRVVWGVDRLTKYTGFDEKLYRNGALDYPGSATWGPATFNGNTCTLDGEIQLSPRLAPSFYNIVIFPFAHSSFAPTGKGPALVHNVEIADLHGDGPHASQRFPPVSSSSSLEIPAASFNFAQVMDRSL